MHMFVWLRRFVWFCLFCISIILACGCYYALKIEQDLPNVNQLKDVEFETPMQIYSEDGKLMAVFGEIKRKPISINDVPKQLINAFISIEDQRFFEHMGFDTKGILRATLEFAKTGKKKQGASTITQQVAKNFFLSRERTFDRKIKELFIALQMERELTKEQILELYLNKIALGHNSYGVAAAAEVYFGKQLHELTLGEMAILAGLPKAPSSYNPISHPQKCKERRNLVLSKMYEYKYINAEQFRDALEEDIVSYYHGPEIEFRSDYVSEMARQRIIDSFGEDVTKKGIKVYTSINSIDQKNADDAVFKGLIDYDHRHGFRGPVEILWTNKDEPWNLDKINEFLKQQKVISYLQPAVVIDVQDKQATVIMKDGTQSIIAWDGIKWAAKFLTDRRIGNAPKNAKEVLKPGFFVYTYTTNEGKTQLSQIPDAQAALVSLDSHNGAIKAIVGGFSFTQSKFNRAEQAKRQPGSNIKPFIYSTAFQNGFTLSTLVMDEPITSWETGKLSKWKPKNSPNVYDGPITVREALAKSKNVVSVRLLRASGLQNVVENLNNFGLNVSKIYQNDSLALGAIDITPLQVARSYTAISNGGFLVEPYIVSKIEDAQGNVIYTANPIIACPTCEDHVLSNTRYSDGKGHIIAPQIISHANSFLVAEAMHTGIYGGAERGLHAFNGTGWRTAREMPKRKDFSGKTGTTNDSRDCWFSGLNGQYVTTVWIGFDNQKRNLGRESGATAAQPIWNYYMTKFMQDKPEFPVIRPKTIEVHKVNKFSGLFVGEGAPNSRNEFFEIGTDPATLSVGRDNFFNYGSSTSNNGNDDELPDASDIF